MTGHSPVLPMTAYDSIGGTEHSASSCAVHVHESLHSSPAPQPGWHWGRWRQRAPQRRECPDIDETGKGKAAHGDASVIATADVSEPVMTPATVWSPPPPLGHASPSPSASFASSSSGKTKASNKTASTTASTTPSAASSTAPLLRRIGTAPGAGSVSTVSAAKTGLSPNDRTPSVFSSDLGRNWFRTEIFCGLVIFFPLAIAAGALQWSPRVVFALSALSVAGLEVFISTALERVCLAHTDQNLPAAACLEIIPNIFPIMIGVAALISDEISVAKSFIIGNVLNNILLGTGLSLFIGGFKPDYEGYKQQIKDTAFELIKLTMIATSPIVMTWAMIYVMTSQAELSVVSVGGGIVSIDSIQADTDTIVSAKTASAIRGLSRGTALILLVVYVVWTLFRLTTHRGLFTEHDRNRRSAAAVIQRRGAWPLRKVAGELKMDKSESEEPPRRRCLSGTPARSIAAGTGRVVSLAAAFVAAIFCCHYLVTSIDPLVGEPGSSAETSSAASSLRRHFVASILLPFIVNFYSDLRAAELASCSGRDVSLAVQLTYGAGASSILLTLPVLVVVGWATDHALLLDFSAFDVSILAGGVWATSILTTSRVDYFRGFVFLCLYSIMALAIFLFKE